MNARAETQLPEYEWVRRAQTIHADLPVVDGHNDLPWEIKVRAGGHLDRADPSGPLEGFHTDIPRMIRGGVGAQFWSVYVPADSPHPFTATLTQIDLVDRMVAHDERLERVTDGGAIRACRRRGHVASLIGAEGGHCIENSLDNLAALAGRGVRYMTLTHSDTTDWADSATDDERHGGLTPFGRRVITEMNALGMLIDISHTAPSTMRHAIDASTTPVIASHSNARGLADHPRNLPDDVIRAVGAMGGVMMVTFVPGFLVDATAKVLRDMFDEWRRLRVAHPDDDASVVDAMRARESDLDIDPGGVADVADHIEYIASLAGVESVGLGSDFDGTTMTPRGLTDVSCYPAITAELLRRGWPEKDIRSVLGDNILRALDGAKTA